MTTCATTSGRSRDRRRARRRHDPAFRAAVADDGGVRDAAGVQVLQYHNITPAAFFAPYDPGLVPARGAWAGASWRRWSGAWTWRSASRSSTAGARVARIRAHRRPADRRRYRAADSGAAAAGARPHPAATGSSTSSSSAESRRTRRSKIISGWRSIYKRYVDSYYRFIFVGRYDGVPRYYAQIRALIAEYQMLPDRFWFTGPVPDEDLAAFYRWARRLRLAERARGLLRAAGRGDGDRRAGRSRTPRAPCRRRSAARDVLFAPKDLGVRRRAAGQRRLRS